MKNSKRNHTKNAYKTAVQAALYGEGCGIMHPAVKYNEATGFFVESDLLGNNPTETTVWVANFSADTGKPFCLPSYEEIEV